MIPPVMEPTKWLPYTEEEREREIGGGGCAFGEREKFLNFEAVRSQPGI